MMMVRTSETRFTRRLRFDLTDHGEIFDRQLVFKKRIKRREKAGTWRYITTIKTPANPERQKSPADLKSISNGLCRWLSDSSSPPFYNQ